SRSSRPSRAAAKGGACPRRRRSREKHGHGSRSNQTVRAADRAARRRHAGARPAAGGRGGAGGRRRHARGGEPLPGGRRRGAAAGPAPAATARRRRAAGPRDPLGAGMLRLWRPGARGGAAMTAVDTDAVSRARRRVAEKITDLIGNTPLVRLRSFERDLPGVEIWCKCEFMNPGGSVKDRAAYRMIADAVADGRLDPSKEIIDSTSGNTGIAY